MKHCVKKLLSLAFALALCLAVGGIALAETPEQEVLDYEPNVTAAPETTTTGNLATEGYQVTIPTTVEVKSGTNTGELEVKAQLKQWRTLNITMKPQDDKWTLKYQDAAADANTPQVAYTLKNEAGEGHTSQNMVWRYDESKHEINYVVTGVTSVDTANIPLTVNVADPSQATMSGTYSDTVSFEFDLTKQCFTYIINVYGQEVKLTSEAFGTSSDFGKKYKGLQAVNMAGNANALYTEQYVLEYGINPDGSVAGGNPGQWQHKAPTEGEKRKAVDGTEKTFTAEDAADYALRWETLAPVPIDPAGDYATSEAAGDKTKTKTIDRNLVRKWYWLDVNGATDYAGDSEDIHGNQGARISGYVNMQVSVDGTNWSSWFWQSDGDDYWGQFPYGIQFKLGFHHVKDGYVYEMSGNGVRIIANKQDTVTDSGTKERGISGFYTTYYVYQDTLTGEPTDKTSKNVRYCYIPCYKKGITYFANEGTGGTEDYNEDNPYRSNVLYKESGELETPDALGITAPADMVFAGWSTSANYPTTGKLYQPDDNVSSVQWETYTSAEMSKRPTGDKQKRELYAIWGYKTDIKIAFEDGLGTTDKNALGVFETVQKGNFIDERTLKTDKIVIPGQTLTLDLNDLDVKAAIAAGTDAVNRDPLYNGVVVTDDKIWDLAQTYTITVPQNKTATLRFEILRKRYLLNVMAVLSPSGKLVTLPTDAATPAKYGTFYVDCNARYQTVGGVSKFSVYQWLHNYGATYEVCKVEANPGYQFVKFMKPAGQGLTSAGDSTHATGIMTGKNENLSYFGGDGKTYTGDTIYVVFKKDMVTFDFNGGTTKDGETSTKEQYFPDSVIPKMLYNSPGTSSLQGWSLNKEKQPNETIYKPDSTRLGDIQWPDPENKVLYARWSTGPNRAPAKKALTVRYHANFDPMEELALDLDPNPLLEDMDEDFGFDPDPLPEDILDPTVEAVKIVTYKPDENVVLRHCMFKRGGYVFVGWNTEPDGTGRNYEVNGVPITDWAAGTTVDLYAQWKKPEHLKPVVDGEPQLGGTTPAPTPQPGGADDAFGIDPHLGGMDDAFGVDPQPGGMDDAFGVDPQPEGLDDAFGIDPQPGGMDDAFGVDPQPGGMDDAFGV